MVARVKAGSWGVLVTSGREEEPRSGKRAAGGKKVKGRRSGPVAPRPKPNLGLWNMADGG